MNKLLIAFGLVVLLVAFPSTAQSDEEIDDSAEAGDIDEEIDGGDSSDRADGSDSGEGGDRDEDGDGDDGSEIDEEIDGHGDEGDDGKGTGEEAKGTFVETDGTKKECKGHEDCYDYREPQAWCRLKEDQSWIDKGCFCDSKSKSCVIERMNAGKVEHTYCAPQEGWKCE